MAISAAFHRRLHFPQAPPAEERHSRGRGVACNRYPTVASARWSARARTAASIRRPRRSRQAIQERLLAGPARSAGAAMREDQKKARANFKEEMRRRIELIAADCGVPEAEIAKVRGRLKHYDLLCFAQKYRISLDGLI